MNEYQVIAPALHLRSKPVVQAQTRLALLAHGHRVRKLAAVEPKPWWRVVTELQGTVVEGFVNSSHLGPADGVQQPVAVVEWAVHLDDGKPVLRGSASRRAFRLNEPQMPMRGMGPPAQRAAQLRQVIDWLAVETSQRYQRTLKSTYCNIYAYDFTSLCGVYLPRVWWTPEALVRMALGEPVPVQYGQSVLELSANSLHRWFEEQGGRFGWQRSFDLDALQSAVNQGSVGIISARNQDPNRSGHIVAVAPELGAQQALREQHRVVAPLQSQAGANNFSYRAKRWWTASDFASFSFWLHD